MIRKLISASAGTLSILIILVGTAMLFVEGVVLVKDIIAHATSDIAAMLEYFNIKYCLRWTAIMGLTGTITYVLSDVLWETDRKQRP